MNNPLVFIPILLAFGSI